MRLRLVSWLFLSAAALASAACSGSSAPAATQPAQEAGRPPVAVTVAPAAASVFEEAVEIVGTLEPKFSADVKSELTGTVKAVHVTEWVPVRKGALLAQLDTSETEAGIAALRAVEAQARVAQARARREYDRALQLKQYGLITPQNLDEAKTAVEAAEAATAAAVAQTRTGETRLAKARIVAPIDGVVAFRGVNVGDRVENMGGNTPAFRIVDTRLFDLTVSVPASQAAAVRVGQPIRFTTDSVPGRTFEGKVKFINPEFDAASRSARVVVEVPNPDGQLKGGAFVEGRIVVASRADVLQVPREALMNWNVEQQRAQVFLARGGVAEKRDVKTGLSNGGSVEIVSGLQAGEAVITRGAFALQPGDRIAVVTGEGA